MLQHVVHAHPASTNPVVGTMLQHVLHAHPASTILSPLQPLFGSARIIYLAKVPLLAPRWKVLSQPAICNAVTKYLLQPSLGSQITVTVPSWTTKNSGKRSTLSSVPLLLQCTLPAPYLCAPSRSTHTPASPGAILLQRLSWAASGHR